MACPTLLYRRMLAECRSKQFACQYLSFQLSTFQIRTVSTKFFEDADAIAQPDLIHKGDAQKN
jgi:hypothetical protein